LAQGRKPSVRYWDSRKAYCCWIAGERHFLAYGPDDAPTGPTYLAALDQFKKLLSKEANKGTDDYLVSSLLNQYRAYLRSTRKSGVPGVFEVMARGFAEQFGEKRVREVKPYDFDQWLERQTQWNPTSKAHAVALILSALSWAKKKGFIQNDPLTGRIERPQPILRGRDARMSEELMDLLIGECFARATYSRKKRTSMPKVHLRWCGFSESFGRYLWLLRITGARPIEIRSAEAHNYQNGRLVFRWNAQKGYIWKNARKSQRDRIIFLTPEAQAHVEQCVKKHPEGPIFRTLRGDPWTPQNIANKWRQWLLNRPKIAAYLEEHGIDTKQMRTYNFRHSAISSFLDCGGDIYVASQLFGTGVKMIERRYGHPNIERLQEQFMAFTAKHHVPMPWGAKAATNDNQFEPPAVERLQSGQDASA
jgi:integrase